MEQEIKKCLEVLRAGGVILYPTDTVWGIGCDASNPEAVEKVYAIKRRSDSKSLVLLASDIDMVAAHVEEIPEMALQLIEVNDKPMTLIYPKAFKPALAPAVVAEDGSVAFRIPKMDFCQKLAHRLRRPLVSTSANLSGAVTPRTYSEISQEILSAVDYVVDPKWAIPGPGRASQIIKVEMDGRFKIIRA
jgi:L-threonylcarbamoyladenylate synthase